MEKSIKTSADSKYIDLHFVSNFGSSVLENLGFGVVVIDSDTHKIVYANSKLLNMCSFSYEKIIGNVCHQLLCPAEIGKCPISDLGKTVDDSERIMIRADGESISIIKTVRSLIVEGRNYLVESIVDNSERQKIREQLIEADQKLKSEIVKHEEIKEQIEHLAYYDYLTGLPNKLLFSKQLDHIIHLADRTEKNIAIMFLDLDGFKMINDAMGHLVGDQLLIEVSSRLKQLIRKSDFIARFGGDEFVIIIENVEDTDSIDIISQKVLQCFGEPFELNNTEYFVTTSIGIAVYPIDGNDAETLIKNADAAMYNAKGRGKNQHSFSHPDLSLKLEETMKLSNQLYRAIERNELEIYYQPQIDIRSKEVIGLEALLRWNHPELGIISPLRFIPIAETTGQIVQIGEWVLRKACQQNKAWQKAGFAKIHIAVNLSIRQFQNNDILKQVSDVLLETGLEPEYLELEITESISMREKGYVVGILNDLKDLGVKIAIDDFGTEYSALNYLRHLPINRLKIARQFVQGIDIGNNDEALVKTIISLAKNMGLKVIAEGVETKAQLESLDGLFCDEVQGFYYYKPMPLHETEKMLKRAKLEAWDFETLEEH